MIFEKEQGIQRVIEESVPGKQVTLAHIIAAPVPELYENLGLENIGAIGILTLTPYETAMIAADYAVKTASVEIGFLDRFTGSVVIAGDVENVETALKNVNAMLEEKLGFIITTVTKT
jgi:Ethanolamine utilization protein